jgi:hypothetical protein
VSRETTPVLCRLTAKYAVLPASTIDAVSVAVPVTSQIKGPLIVIFPDDPAPKQAAGATFAPPAEFVVGLRAGSESGGTGLVAGGLVFQVSVIADDASAATVLTWRESY